MIVRRQRRSTSPAASRRALHHLLFVVVIAHRAAAVGAELGFERAVDDFVGGVDAVPRGHDEVRRDERARAEAPAQLPFVLPMQRRPRTGARRRRRCRPGCLRGRRRRRRLTRPGATPTANSRAVNDETNERERRPGAELSQPHGPESVRADLTRATRHTCCCGHHFTVSLPPCVVYIRGAASAGNFAVPAASGLLVRRRADFHARLPSRRRNVIEDRTLSLSRWVWPWRSPRRPPLPRTPRHPAGQAARRRLASSPEGRHQDGARRRPDGCEAVEEEDQVSDHEKVVGHVGVGYLGLTTLPLARRATAFRRRSARRSSAFATGSRRRSASTSASASA